MFLCISSPLTPSIAFNPHEGRGFRLSILEHRGLRLSEGKKPPPAWLALPLACCWSWQQ